MTKKKTKYLKFSIITILTAALWLLPALSAPRPCWGSATVKNLRLGYNKEGIRLVIDVTGKPDYQVRSIKDSSKIFIDVYNARLAGGFKTPLLKSNRLIKHLSVRQYNLRQVQVEIDLSYGIPIDNVHAFTLENPGRIAVDLYRNYHSFIQFHVTENVIWLQTERAANGLFTLINELYVNHKSPRVSVKVELARGKNNRETICSMVGRTGAIAGINGGYFGKGGASLGLVVSDGKILARTVKSRPPRSAFAIDFDRNVLIDRVVDKGEKIITLAGRTWRNIVLAVGAGPRLIKMGQVNITAHAEGLGKGGNDITRRTGRSAVGVNSKGTLVFMTASGFRSNHKDGMKLPDMAKYMKTRQVTEAMNLDGGGSTAMSILGTLVSRPPMQGKWQRPVANGILFFDKSPIISPRYMGIAPEQVVLPADGKSKMKIQVLITDASEKPVPDKTPLSIASGIGLFKKKYHYTRRGLVNLNMTSARAPGNYSIKIDCGPVRKFLPVKLQAGPPCRVYHKAVPVKNGRKKNRYLIKVLVCDSYKNALSRVPVEFNVKSGKGSLTTKKTFTRPNGEADTTVTLSSKKVTVRASVKGLGPIHVNLTK